MTTHRKMIEYPVNATEAAILCSFQCDPIQNPSYDCMPICSDICPKNCYTSPAISPPYDGGYIYTTPPKHHHVSLSLPLKISLFILVITFSLFLLYTLYKFYTVWYRARFRRSPSSPENQETHEEFVDHDIVDHPIWYIRTIGLNPSVISAITVVKYKKTEEIIDGTSCSVCLSDFQENEALRLLPKCNHAFHISCIDTWLRSHTNCPLCRAGIVKNVTNNNNSLSLDENLGGSGTGEEARVEISVREDGEVEEGQRVVDGDDQRLDLRIRVDNDDENNKADGSSGTSEILIIRRSVSLNDYAACRVRNDVLNHNNYYSDRHDVQIRSLDGGNMGFDVVKVEQTPNNRGN
uniref:RING-H2 finger protein ATL54-like n=1 Tax=Erigeron canadensis TaxID=72917 RepID=UPI001CB9D1FD|nr:RING-H2 finger protein ATL54-like [Erigeron canadensis]